MSLHCDVLHQHAGSDMHAAAVRIQQPCLVEETSGDIQETMRGGVHAERRQ